MDAGREREGQLARLAARQQGVVTAAQVAALGISPDASQRRVRAGRWVRVVPGVFAVAGTSNTWKQRTMAAVLAAGPGAAASHTTAAALYNLSCCPFRRVEILVPEGRSHRSRLATVHETAHVARGDVTTIDRIPVTRPARTLIDLAGMVGRGVLEEAIDDALVRRLVSLHRLRQRVDDLAGPGRSGSLLIREVLESWSDAEMPEELAEKRLVRRLVVNVQPVPVLQHKVYDAAGKVVARPDAAYPDAKVAVELNGFRWHGTPRRYALDQARLRRLAALGWLVLPVTPADLRGDGRAVAVQVGAALEHASPAKRCG